jgi:hypothetical protein
MPSNTSSIVYQESDPRIQEERVKGMQSESDRLRQETENTAERAENIIEQGDMQADIDAANVAQKTAAEQGMAVQGATALQAGLKGLDVGKKVLTGASTAAKALKTLDTAKAFQQGLSGTKDLIGTVSGGSLAQIRGQRHYYLMGGYDLDLENGFVLQPAIMVKSDLVTTQLDLNVAAMYNNQLWGGVTYRVNDAFAVMAGYQLTKDLRATYSYDITTSSLSNSSSGSHEIMMSYCFTIEIPPKEKGSYRNPIFL